MTLGFSIATNQSPVSPSVSSNVPLADAAPIIALDIIELQLNMMNTPARLLQGWAARPSALRCGVLLLLLVPTATVAIHTPARAPLWAWTENLLPEYKEEVAKWRSRFSETTFVFCFSTGHAGTTTLGATFNNAAASSFSVSEMMVPNQEKTNPALKKARNKGDGRWMWKYILHQKLPEYVKQGRAMLSAKSKVHVSPTDMARAPPRHIFEFGHQINAFGLLSVFLQIFPNNTKVMRLRRAHCEVIESFKHNTMCPAYWNDNKWLGVHNCPGDPDSLFKPPQRMWKASKLLRTWWFLDEVELEWQEVLKKYPKLVCTRNFIGRNVATMVQQSTTSRLKMWSKVFKPGWGLILSRKQELKTALI